jgi:ESX secretion-associated protein EspG
LDLPDFALHRASEPDRPAKVSVLETTCEGVWLLQAFCGVETLPAALMLQPYFSAAGPPVDHPGVTALRKAGVLFDDYTVHPRVAEWIEVLGAPDIELFGDVRRGNDFQDYLQLAVARRDDRHVAALRHNDTVTIEELGRVGSLRELVERILPLCGPPVAPVDFEPVTVPTLALLEGLGDVVRSERAPAVALAELGLSARQRKVLMRAADQPLTALSLGVIQHDSHGDHIANSAVSVTDTTDGRMVTGPARDEDGTWWTHISPGTIDAVTRSLRSVVATLPTPAWREHSRLN